MSFCNNFDNCISKDNSLVNWKYEQKAAQNLSRAARAVANWTISSDTQLLTKQMLTKTLKLTLKAILLAKHPRWISRCGVPISSPFSRVRKRSYLFHGQNSQCRDQFLSFSGWMSLQARREAGGPIVSDRLEWYIYPTHCEYVSFHRLIPDWQ